MDDEEARARAREVVLGVVLGRWQAWGSAGLRWDELELASVGRSAAWALAQGTREPVGGAVGATLEDLIGRGYL